jgi:integrase
MDAEHWLAEERRLIERDEWTPPNTRAAQHKAQAITLSDYADKWIEQRNLKSGTAIEYRRIKARLIDPTIGRLPLRAVTADAVRGWYVNLGTEAPRRNSHAYGLLHGILGTAVKDGMLAANPCQITRAMNPLTQRQAVSLTVAELAAVADAIRPEQLRALVLVSAWLGLRWGEVIELRRKRRGRHV